MRKPLFVLMLMLFLSPAAVMAATYTNTAPANSNAIPRISGIDRYTTARLISEQYTNEAVDCVILTTGSNYADALGASVLAFQKQAPVLLAAGSLSGSSEAVSFIQDHLTSNGTIYIIGGKGVIGEAFETYFTNKGYKIKRLGGASRYETDILIADEVNAAKGTPVVIASGKNFPDALSISSPAAANGWPILLVDKNSISQEVLTYLSKAAPSKVYIAGGTGVISTDVEAKIQQWVPSTQIYRIQGQDRFETSMNIAKFFYPDAALQFLASGINFPDALAGSVLAAKNKSPILLIDHNQTALPKPLLSYLGSNANKSTLNFIVLGGEGMITDQQAQLVTEALSPVTVSASQKDGNLLNSINHRRKAAGLDPFIANDTLSSIAKLKSEDMLTSGVSYDSERYGTIEDMLSAQKYTYTHVSYDIFSTDDPSNILDTLTNSSKANEKIFSLTANYIGIGVTDSPVYGKLYTIIYLEK